MEVTDEDKQIHRFHGKEVMRGKERSNVIVVYYVGNERYRYVRYSVYVTVSNKVKWSRIQDVFPAICAAHGDPVIIELD